MVSFKSLQTATAVILLAASGANAIKFTLLDKGFSGCKIRVDDAEGCTTTNSLSNWYSCNAINDVVSPF